MQKNDGHAVATFLDDVVERGERNRLADTALPGADGARMALETFYHAFNARSLELIRRVWLDDPFIQLNNPVGGIVRGAEEIGALYARIFEGPVRVRVEFHDVVLYTAPDTVVFAGRERGSYGRDGGGTVPLDIRTSRIFRYAEDQGGWRQIHHHGSIDDPESLARYQSAIRGD